MWHELLPADQPLGQLGEFAHVQDTSSAEMEINEEAEEEVMKEEEEQERWLLKIRVQGLLGLLVVRRRECSVATRTV